MMESTEELELVKGDEEKSEEVKDEIKKETAEEIKLEESDALCSAEQSEVKATIDLDFDEKCPDGAVKKTVKGNKLEIKTEEVIIVDNDIKRETKIELKKETLYDQYYICYHCGYSTEEFKILRRHIKRKHFNSEVLLLINALMGSTETLLSERRVVYVPKKRKKFKGKICPHCDYCPSSSRSEDICNRNLQRHIKEVHAKRSEFFCEYCSHSTFRKSELKRHIERKHKPSWNKIHKPVFSCELCSFETRGSHSLKRHLFFKHSVESGFKAEELRCKLCSYTTYDRKCFQTHLLHNHTPGRQFACPHCPHSAKTPGDLKTHVRSIHLKERHWVCPHCDYSATRKTHLGQHVKRVHSLERPYSCPHCDWAGVTPSDLKAHVARKHK